MDAWFEELDYQNTPMGELILQRRRIAALNDVEAYEVKLGEEYLMSSLFYEAEVALADKALEELSGTGWDVVVGGLGLGYTAAATLRFQQVKRLIVVETLEPVIAWHRQGLVPNGKTLSADSRCVYHPADFFVCARGSGFDPDTANRRFDAILLDIDHTPAHVLSPSHANFYTEDGLRKLTRFLKPGGVFGLWSNDEPNQRFLAVLKRVFTRAEGHAVKFKNPLQQNVSANGIYIATVSNTATSES